ncbi:MAG: Penicillin-binding protein 1A [Alphaproteobacteria bacterium MarineAlpha10_Bin2]|nr:MAG: Penicillin-binding protein 1A [Alphaproteobacteria bacterium MarineAlpha10_Bin2]
MKYLYYSLAGLLLVAVIVVAVVVYLFYQYGRDLPDHRQLAAYEPDTMTRVHAGDGRLVAEYATEKRVFVPIGAMPKRVVDAFLSAEDKNFYDHFGLDPISVAGALIQNVSNFGSDKRLVGASTITQQVAKNFLLTNETSMERKFKEAILAIRIEDAFTKNRILELYLNEIYLGYRSFGVAAAALNYFNKSLDELSLAEAAYLAALPKAPNNYHPTKKYDAAVSRRDWVLSQMADNGKIGSDEAEVAALEPLRTTQRDQEEFVSAAYFTEEVRRWLFDKFGETELYRGGLSVRTTLDPLLQRHADTALRDGLQAYDRRHGWRGPLANVGPKAENWRERFTALALKLPHVSWRLAFVQEVTPKAALFLLEDGIAGELSVAELEWARETRKGQRLGPKVKDPAQVLAAGDVIYVEAVAASENTPAGFALRQIPDAGGALVALDPHTGRVLALSGGYDFALSQFNRATQAERQPGSAFKPFVYLAALDNGFTPASVVLDAPYVIDQGEGQGKWKPENYSQKFYGPSTLRLGLEKSRNLMTVRIAQHIGMETVASYAKRFNVHPNLPLMPSMALGAGETTVLRLTSAYAMLVNGGRQIVPAFVERIQDRHGRTIYTRDGRACEHCSEISWDGQQPPALPDTRDQVADPASAYQVVSMLEGVVLRGTGRSVKELGKPIGGKTGTTNNFNDAWFVGFTPDLAVGVYVGFDQPKTLGRRESGGKVAAPIFREFMRQALAETPAIPFRVPRGIRFVRIDIETGMVAREGDKNVLVEAFRIGTEPSPLSRQAGNQSNPDGTPILTEGSGGLY